MHVREVPLHGGTVARRRVARPARSTCSPSTGSATARSSTARARRTVPGGRGAPPTAITAPAAGTTAAWTGRARPSASLFARTARSSACGATSFSRACLPHRCGRQPRQARRRSSRAPRGTPTRRSCARSRVIASSIRVAIVHHTAGTNDYTPRAGGGDRARHRALPRRRQRLERHRLQLSRRPVRHDLRGSRRWNRPERRRRACAGVQRGDGRAWR